MRNTLFFLVITIELLAGIAEAALIPYIPRRLGETWSIVPFGDTFPDERPPFRMQQVYAASAFSNSMSQGGWITGMWLVSDGQAGRGFSTTMPKVEIRLGITSRGLDALSPVFAENFSGPTIAVQPLGPLHIYAPGQGSSVEFVFGKPFFYKPADGNLLLEVKNYEAPLRWFDPLVNTSAFDASNVNGDTVSRVYAHGDADAAEGTVDSLGLTTRFRFVYSEQSLSIARPSPGSTNLVLRWDRSPLMPIVERSLVLGPAANWQPVSGPIGTNPVEDSVLMFLPLETRSPGAFFRLKFPGLFGGGGGSGPAAENALECADADNDDNEEGVGPCP